jgi:hypothetical protein
MYSVVSRSRATRGIAIWLGKNLYARLTFGYGLDRVPLLPRSYEITFQLVASAF